MGPSRQVQGGQRCALCEDHHDAQSGMSIPYAALSQISCFHKHVYGYSTVEWCRYVTWIDLILQFLYHKVDAFAAPLLLRVLTLSLSCCFQTFYRRLNQPPRKNKKRRVREVDVDISAKAPLTETEAMPPLQWRSSTSIPPREPRLPPPPSQLDESADEGDIDIEDGALGDGKYLASTSEKASDSDADCDSHSDEVGDDDRLADRGAGNREYLKSTLMAHDIWKDRSFWEQTLWQCTMEQVRYSTSNNPSLLTTSMSIENNISSILSRKEDFTSHRFPVFQLHTIPCERAWHDLPEEQRLEPVRMVHSVIFSQVYEQLSLSDCGCAFRYCTLLIFNV